MGKVWRREKPGKINKLLLKEECIFKVFNSIKSKSARKFCQIGKKPVFLGL